MPRGNDDKVAPTHYTTADQIQEQPGPKNLAADVEEGPLPAVWTEFFGRLHRDLNLDLHGGSFLRRSR